MQKRRFECTLPGHNKFWEVETTASSDAVVRYGRRGTPGSVQVKTFADRWAAESYASKMIREKINKGYEEVAAGAGSNSRAADVVRRTNQAAAEVEAAAIPVPITSAEPQRHRRRVQATQ